MDAAENAWLAHGAALRCDLARRVRVAWAWRAANLVSKRTPNNAPPCGAGSICVHAERVGTLLAEGGVDAVAGAAAPPPALGA